MFSRNQKLARLGLINLSTKLVMTLSAIFMAIIGILASFIPHEILTFVGLPTHQPLPQLIQVLGAMYFAFAMLNWMSKGSIIGGIYNRPTATANWTHFVIAGLALIKGILSDPDHSYVMWSLAIIYSMFAILFGIVLFKRPATEIEKDNQAP